MRIRPAGERDIERIAEIAERAYAVYVERIGRRPQPMDEDYGARVREGTVLVVEDGPAVAGFVVLVEEADHLLVDNVGVDPAAQHRGLGRALLARAEEVARQRGLPELRLYTNEAMTENIALYRRLGYRETERRREHGFARVFMTKPAGGR